MEVSKTVLMGPKNKDIYKNWLCLQKESGRDFMNALTFFMTILYRFGLSLYKNPELVKEGIHNLLLNFGEIKHKLADVQNVQQYTLTIYKRILIQNLPAICRRNPNGGLIDDIAAESIPDRTIVRIGTDSQPAR
jgi:hypothetical protein